MVFTYTLLKFPYQENADGLLTPNVYDNYCIIASKYNLLQVFKRFNGAEVKLLGIAPDDPIPEKYLKTFFINPSNKNDLAKVEEIKRLNPDACYDLFKIGNNRLIYPYLVKEGNEEKSLDIFNKEDFDVKNKLHVIHFDNELYFLYYIQFKTFFIDEYEEKEFKDLLILKFKKIINSFISNISNPNYENNNFFNYSGVDFNTLI